MKNQLSLIGPKTPSESEIPHPDRIRPIREWQQKFERYLLLTDRKATRERYARALERFLGKYPEKIYPHEFLRPQINDYIQTRLAEGAAVSTIRLELSAIRGLWSFMQDMGARDVLLNPARGVKVPRKTKNEPSTMPLEGADQSASVSGGMSDIEPQMPSNSPKQAA